MTVLLLLAVSFSGCRPEFAAAKEIAEFSVTTERGATPGTFWVKLRWTLAAVTDGRGPIDSVQTGISGGAFAQRTHTPTATRDSFSVVAAATGTPLTGQGCIKAKRRALWSAQTCKPWGYTESDVAPPAPTLDSVVTVGVGASADTVRDDGVRILPRGEIVLEPGQSYLLCLGGITMSGRRVLIRQRGYDIHSECWERYRDWLNQRDV